MHDKPRLTVIYAGLCHSRGYQAIRAPIIPHERWV